VVFDRLESLDTRFVSVLIGSDGTAPPQSHAVADRHGEIARLFGAQPGTLYLLRPDLHIAGRWKFIVADEIIRTARICLGKQTQ
jgi:3-(3-hydroxy-phenyl)propionate hydroxylase